MGRRSPDRTRRPARGLATRHVRDDPVPANAVRTGRTARPLPPTTGPIARPSVPTRTGRAGAPPPSRSRRPARGVAVEARPQGSRARSDVRPGRLSLPRTAHQGARPHLTTMGRAGRRFSAGAAPITRIAARPSASSPATSNLAGETLARGKSMRSPSDRGLR
jgi:hypothetical protein